MEQNDPEAARMRKAAERAAELKQRQLEAYLSRPVPECLDGARLALKRRCEELEAALAPSERELMWAEKAMKGYYADMTSAERAASCPPWAVRIQACARERRVRNLTRRVAAERSARNVQ